MDKILINLPCAAYVSVGFFTDEPPFLNTITQKGVVTEFDEKSKYVTWNIDGVVQPIVNIDSVSFIL